MARKRSRVAPGLRKVGGDLTVAGGITATNDIAAGGGYRHWVGPFTILNLGASQTDAAVTSLGGNIYLTMCRAGSITGVSVSMTVAGAGSNMVIDIWKSPSEYITAAVTIAPGATSGYVTFAKDLYPFNAGDKLSVRATTDGSWSATTTDIDAYIEVET